MAGGRAGSAAARPDGKRGDQLCKPGEARRAIRTGGLKMRKRLLGRTGVLVSEFALGTMTFGQEADETSADALMDHYVESGGSPWPAVNPPPPPGRIRRAQRNSRRHVT